MVISLPTQAYFKKKMRVRKIIGTLSILFLLALTSLAPITIAASPTVETRDATGVQTYNATFNGYLATNGGVTATCGFRYGTQSGTYAENITIGAQVNDSDFAIGSCETMISHESGEDENLIKGNVWSSQSFTPEYGIKITGVTLRFFADDVPTDDFYVSIRATSGGKPTGSDLALVVVNKSVIPLDSAATTYIPFETTVFLSSGTKYAFVMRCPESDIAVRVNYNHGSGTYAGGNRLHSSNSGSSWVEFSGHDYWFKLEGTRLNLNPGERYYYQAWANNSEGFSTGVEKSLLTKPVKPTDFTITAHSPTQLDLSWTKGSGANTTYIVRKQGSYPSDRNDGTIVYNSTGTSFNDNGVSPGISYNYKAWSYTTWSSFVQWSENTAQGNKTTAKSVPTVTTNTTTAITTSVAQLWGYVVEDGGEACTVRFEYGLNTSYGTNTTNQTKTKGDACSQNLTNLQRGQRYQYRIYANNSIGATVGSNNAFVTRPAEPTNLSVSTKGRRSITLSWTKGLSANKTVIVRKTDGYSPSPGEGTIVYNGTGTSYVDGGLSPSTTYYYRAWAYAVWGSLYQRSIAYDGVSETTVASATEEPPKAHLATDAYTNGSSTNEQEEDSEDFLFDVLLEIPDDIVVEGDAVETIITLINVGESGIVNGTLALAVLQGEETLWEDEQTVSVSGQKALNASFPTANLAPGVYTYSVVFTYGDEQTASAQGSFSIEEEPTITPTTSWLIPGAIIGAIVLIVLVGIIIRVKKINHDR